MTNLVVLHGNLGQAPQVRGNGIKVTVFSLATNERYTNRSGEKVERTDWHNIVVFGNQGDACAKYLSKGDTVLVEGRLRNNNYEKDGVKHYRTEVHARSVQFLTPKSRSKAPTQADGFEDNVPF